MATRFCFVVFFLCVLIIPTHAQLDSDYRNFQVIPESIPKEVPTIVAYLTQGAPSDSEKVVRIYAWITYNIMYDYEAFMSANIKQQTATQTIQSGKGICSHYADLFVEMCQYAGIKARTISGYTKAGDYEVGDKFYYTNHAWNAVFLSEKWYLVDPTWGSGKKEYLNLDSLEAIHKADSISQKEKIMPSPKMDSISKTNIIIPPVSKKTQYVAKTKSSSQKHRRLTQKQRKAFRPIKEIVPPPLKPLPLLPLKQPNPIPRIAQKSPPAKPRMGWTTLRYTDWRSLFVKPTEFVLTHAPNLTGWQLLPNPVSIETFAMGQDSIKTYLGEYYPKTYDFEAFIAYYEAFDEHFFLIMEAQETHKYNPNDHFTEMLNYYNYQLVYKDSDKDSILYYCKLARKSAILAKKSIYTQKKEMIQRLTYKKNLVLKWGKRCSLSPTKPLPKKGGFKLRFTKKTSIFLNEVRANKQLKKKEFSQIVKNEEVKEADYPTLIQCILSFSANMDKGDSLLSILNEGDFFEEQEALWAKREELLGFLSTYKAQFRLLKKDLARNISNKDLQVQMQALYNYRDLECEVRAEILQYQINFKQALAEEEAKIFQLFQMIAQNKDLLIQLKSLTPCGNEADQWQEVAQMEKVANQKLKILKNKIATFNTTQTKMYEKEYELQNEVLDLYAENVAEAKLQYTKWLNYQEASYQKMLKTTQKIINVCTEEIKRLNK